MERNKTTISLGDNSYKLAQLRKMLDAEEGKLGADGAGYGAHLTHWAGHGIPVNIDAGALRAVIAYYEGAENNKGQGADKNEERR